MTAGKPDAVGARRLAAQRVVGARSAGVAEVVAWMGAVQAQDAVAATWAVGLRTASPRVTEADVETELAQGRVIRTHALRGTWQLVVPADVRWMVALVGPRLVARDAARLRQLGLDDADFRKSRAVLARVLPGGHELTRDELSTALAQAGVDATGPRLSHLLVRAELEGLVCGGARRGKQPTYAWLDDRVPRAAASPDREAALGELARRYFCSRGPATLADYGWWSGLTVAEARAGLEAARPHLVAEVLGGRTLWRAAVSSSPVDPLAAHLLPAFDEFLVAYQDRSDVLEPAQAARVNAGGGMLSPCVVVGGRVVGTWRRTLARGTVSVEVAPFAPLKARAREAVAEAAARYGRYLGREVTVQVVT